MTLYKTAMTALMTAGLFGVLLGGRTLAAPSVASHAVRGLALSDERTRNQWVSESLTQMETVRTGMTRGDLLKVFAEEGGLSTRGQRTYGFRGCKLFKVDVEFAPVGPGRPDALGHVTLESPDDIIQRISKPYIGRVIID